MKKKGLLISTIVMVVVLIAALTTSTYAWFTTSAVVQVNDISLSVKSASNVLVGVKFQEPSGNAANSPNNYYKNTVSLTESPSGNTVEWASSIDVGFGSELTFDGLNLGGSKAIGTSRKPSNNTTWTKAVDSKTDVLNRDNYIIKAEGKAGTNKNNEVDSNTVEIATANVDYLDATIGISANKAGMKGMFAKFVVKTNDNEAQLGVNAAIHFVIEIGNNYVEIEPFGPNIGENDVDTGFKNSTLKSETTLPIPANGCIVKKENSQLTSTFYVWIAQKTDTEQNEADKTFKTDYAEIVDFRILAYIDGTDSSCVLDAKGGCTISISFDATDDLQKITEDGAQVMIGDNHKFFTLSAKSSN